MTVYAGKSAINVCYSDISTGFIETTELVGDDKFKLLDDVLARVKPSEILCNLSFKTESESLAAVKLGYVPAFYPQDSLFEYKQAKNLVLKQFAVNNLAALGLEDKKELTNRIKTGLLITHSFNGVITPPGSKLLHVALNLATLKATFFVLGANVNKNMSKIRLKIEFIINLR